MPLLKKKYKNPYRLTLSTNILYHYSSLFYRYYILFGFFFNNLNIFFVFLSGHYSFLVTLDVLFVLPFSTVFLILFLFFFASFYFVTIILRYSLFIKFDLFYLHLFLKLTNTDACFILTSRCPVATTVMACAMRVFKTL